MIQRFFFNGVGVARNYLAVDMSEEPTFDILPYSAKPEFLISNLTMMAAEKAVH